MTHTGFVLVMENEAPVELCRACADLVYVDGDFGRTWQDIECGRCGETVNVPEPEEEDPFCFTCNGTGEPTSGPPDRGFCRDCGGHGYNRYPEPSYDD